MELLDRLDEMGQRIAGYYMDGPEEDWHLAQAIVELRDMIAAERRKAPVAPTPTAERTERDRLIQLNGQAIAALEKARRMLSAELDSGSFNNMSLMHHAQNIVQCVVQDIDTALMRDANHSVEGATPTAPEDSETETLAHDAEVGRVHARLVARLNEIKSMSVVLEEAAEEIVNVNASRATSTALSCPGFPDCECGKPHDADGGRPTPKALLETSRHWRASNDFPEEPPRVDAVAEPQWGALDPAIRYVEVHWWDGSGARSRTFHRPRLAATLRGETPPKEKKS